MATQIEVREVPSQPCVVVRGVCESGTLGGGREALAIHIGSYEGLPAAHRAVMAFVKENGLQVAGAPYEIYLDDCSVVPVERVRTEVRWPVASA